MRLTILGYGTNLHPTRATPIGFLLVEKIFNLLFGRNEYGLRLLSLLAGMLSIWLFYLLLKHVTTGTGRITALALFVLNPRLVYYSSEAKQYIVDVVVMLALLLVAAPLLESKFQKRNLAWLIVTGFIALWFSHPAIFVLAGIGLTLAILCLHRRDFSSLWSVLGMGAVWLATIGFLYVLVLNDISRNAYMREYWQGAFLPLLPRPAAGAVHATAVCAGDDATAELCDRQHPALAAAARGVKQAWADDRAGACRPFFYPGLGQRG